ncbi:MAG: suppressor of fused domain protein [Bryobacteraceae bacterium]
MVRVEDSPSNGLVSYGTIGLFQSPLRAGRRDLPIRLELIGFSHAGDDRMEQVLCESAAELGHRRLLAFPGCILHGLIGGIFSGSRLPHAYLSGPDRWSARFGTVSHKSLEVHFLHVVPVTDPEAGYLKQHGFEKFEKLLATAGDLAGWDRPCLVSKAPDAAMAAAAAH